MVKCIAWNQCRRVLCLPWPIKKSWGQCDSQRFLQSFHQRWIAWWNRPAQHCLCAFKGQCNVRNQSSRNFSVYRPQYFDWNPQTSTAGNVLGFWSIYWSWGLQKNHPQAAFCNSGKVLPSCWPEYRGPSGSALQSSPVGYSARTEVFWSLHAWQKHHRVRRACEVQR